jgi:glycosyltransferase involved in cell wall biosynthesis
MPTMPKVSICLPVYNGENYLAKAIESALAQTFGDFELLIANDCSTDQTQQIIDNYVKKDKRIKSWINEKNLKLFGNYNACMERASGEFIKLFAHDDLFDPTLLQRMLDVFAKHPNLSLVTSARCWIDADGKRIEADSERAAQIMRPFEQDTQLTAAEAITGTMKELTNWLGEPSSQMFRKAHADGGYDTNFKQIGDLELSYRLLQHGDYYFIADELCFFRSHQESWSTGRMLDLTAYLDWFLLGSKYNQYLAQTGLTSDEYCLKVIRLIASNLEDRLHKSERLGPEGQQAVLRELFVGSDPLSFFTASKKKPRDLDEELRALGAIAFLQSAVLENEIRIAHDEMSREYNLDPELKSELLPLTRPDMAKGIAGLKRALKRKDRRLEAVKFAVRKGHLNSQSLKQTIKGLEQTIAEQEKEIESLRNSLDDMGNSLSWKVTQPLRKLKGQLH